ncbi:RNA polymerase subunit sigma-70 [Nonomuraea sp. NPDC047897]|uniref:RNA polymerase subunit sigma-70 n=1 Tax=Nonomuraea sp. NPDC047897 TaxID=3364346 RepID=UPI00371ABAFF
MRVRDDGAATAAQTLRRQDFARLTDPFRAELLTHCRRMTGSAHDAEDLVQETYLRAWRAYDEFEGRSSIRTWLHRIATNVCLTALDSRRRLPVPAGLPESRPEHDDAVPGPLDGGAGQRPLPDAQPGLAADPAEIVVTRDDRRRALTLVWQRLSPRQRAVLILRDVLAWHANEIADLLGTSGSAVHSMLRRARAQLAQATPAPAGTAAQHHAQHRAGPGEAAPHDAGPHDAGPDDLRLRLLLEEYAAAFETGDVNALVRLLTDDAVCERRPAATVLDGPGEITRFLEHCPAMGECRMLPISVNGRPGFGVYRRSPGGDYRAYTIDVLTITGAGLERIEVLEDRALFGTFGLPMVLAGDHV